MVLPLASHVMRRAQCFTARSNRSGDIDSLGMQSACWMGIAGVGERYEVLPVSMLCLAKVDLSTTAAHRRAHEIFYVGGIFDVHINPRGFLRGVD